MSKSLSFIGWIQCHIDYANRLCECLRHTLLKLEGKYLRRQARILKPMSCSYIPALVNYKLLRNQFLFSFYRVQLAQDVLNIVLLHRTGMLAMFTLCAGIFLFENSFSLRKKKILFFKLKKKKDKADIVEKNLIKNNKIVVLNTSPSSPHYPNATPIFHFEKETKVREFGEKLGEIKKII